MSFHPQSNMSYRDRTQKPQIGSHHRVFSYDITKKSHHQSSSSSSSSSLQKESHDKINSGHRRVVIEQKNNDEQSSESRINSDNETENFIRAEFNKYQVQRKEENFKLFAKNNGKKKESQVKSSKNIYNQETAKQPNSKKSNYETTYFQIQIQEKPNHNPKKLQQKPILKPSQLSNPQSHQPISNHRYSQLQHLQTAIMHTLKQKQKQILQLQNDLTTLNEQKILAFKINQQLQNELICLRRKTAQAEEIKNFSKDEIKWKPQTVQQMKLLIENQRLLEELQKLNEQEQKIKNIFEDITDQQKILRQSLQTAFKTRKDYIKALTRDNNQQEQTHTCTKHPMMKASNTKISRQTILKAKPFINKTTHFSKTIQNNKKIIRTKTPTYPPKTQHLEISKQLSSMKEKELLLKLVQDFNQLKNKVDESLISKSKDKPRTKSNMSTEVKSRRKVVFHRI